VNTSSDKKRQDAPISANYETDSKKKLTSDEHAVVDIKDKVERHSRSERKPK